MSWLLISCIALSLPALPISGQESHPEIVCHLGHPWEHGHFREVPDPATSGNWRAEALAVSDSAVSTSV
jgi:hypothetical protein